MGLMSQGGSAASRRVFLVKSEGHVWRRRLDSCFHRGLGADAIFSSSACSSSAVMKFGM